MTIWTKVFTTKVAIEPNFHIQYEMLIIWIVFYAVSAIFQPFIGGILKSSHCVGSDVTLCYTGAISCFEIKIFFK